MYIHEILHLSPVVQRDEIPHLVYPMLGQPSLRHPQQHEINPFSVGRVQL